MDTVEYSNVPNLWFYNLQNDGKIGCVVAHALHCIIAHSKISHQASSANISCGNY